MVDYCSPGDLYDFGLPRGAVPNPGRLVAHVSAGADSIALDVHGFETDDPLTVRAEAGGSLPAPLAEATTYYAIPLTPSAFSVAATAGGAAIDFLTSGVRVVVVAPLPVAKAISWASRIIEDSLPAHLVPLADPIPEIVKATCAELAAGKLAGRSGAASKSLSEIVDLANKRLARWAKGIPLRGADVPPAANKAVTSTSASSPNPWRRFGGIC